MEVGNRIYYIKVDLGIKDFAVRSTREKVKNPKYLINL